MSEENGKVRGRKTKAIVVVAGICVIALAVVGVRWFDQARKQQVADAKAKSELAARQDAHKAAFQAYFGPRFKRLEKLQKKRVRTYEHPDKSERNLSVAAIAVDYDDDGLPEMVIDQPALQYERKNKVNYDGMYMGNMQVGLFLNGKVQALPVNPRKALLRKKRNIASTVYVTEDRSRISVVIRTGGEDGVCDGYLYEVTDTGVKEISRQCEVRERMPSEVTKGSYKSAPGYKAFRKKYMLKDAAVYKEELSYDKEGNMRQYRSLKDYRDALAAWGGVA